MVGSGASSRQCSYACAACNPKSSNGLPDMGTKAQSAEYAFARAHLVWFLASDRLFLCKTYSTEVE